MKVTRSFDASRIVTMACIATIADVVLRTVVTDTPRLPSMFYNGTGDGPIKPFGFDIGQFARESAGLLLTVPELATCRSLILDYFTAQTAGDEPMLTKDQFVFQFEGPYFGKEEKQWMCSKPTR